MKPKPPKGNMIINVLYSHIGYLGDVFLNEWFSVLPENMNKTFSFMDLMFFRELRLIKPN